MRFSKSVLLPFILPAFILLIPGCDNSTESGTGSIIGEWRQTQEISYHQDGSVETRTISEDDAMILKFKSDHSLEMILPYSTLEGDDLFGDGTWETEDGILTMEFSIETMGTSQSVSVQMEYEIDGDTLKITDDNIVSLPGETNPIVKVVSKFKKVA